MTQSSFLLFNYIHRYCIDNVQSRTLLFLYFSLKRYYPLDKNVLFFIDNVILLRTRETNRISFHTQVLLLKNNLCNFTARRHNDN